MSEPTCEGSPDPNCTVFIINGPAEVGGASDQLPAEDTCYYLGGGAWQTARSMMPCGPAITATTSHAAYVGRALPATGSASGPVVLGGGMSLLLGLAMLKASRQHV